MTAPVLDPARSAPAPGTRRRPASPASTPAPARPHLRVLGKDERAREHDQRRLVRQVAAVLTTLLALCVFGVVVFHVVLTQNQFRLDALESQAEERQAEYDRLRLQVAQLESPDRVVADAQTRLGLVAPPKVTYLTPAVDEPSAGAAAPPPVAADTAVGGGTGWAVVKPHLAGR